jgi:hypothetical protein
MPNTDDSKQTIIEKLLFELNSIWTEKKALKKREKEVRTELKALHEADAGLEPGPLRPTVTTTQRYNVEKASVHPAGPPQGAGNEAPLVEGDEPGETTAVADLPRPGRFGSRIKYLVGSYRRSGVGDDAIREAFLEAAERYGDLQLDSDGLKRWCDYLADWLAQSSDSHPMARVKSDSAMMIRELVFASTWFNDPDDYRSYVMAAVEDALKKP